jgi:glycosyltransferase involved in cell wall biosynthesis
MQTMLSFVIPAHNEEALLGDTLRALRTAAEAAAVPFELIVVNDGSTDQTAEIAQSCGATVVTVHVRKIAAARNAGARAARGETLIFVDADTLVPAKTVAAVMAQLRRGVVGGGAQVRLDAGAPLWGRAFAGLVVAIYSQQRLAGGCFLFARRDAFDAVGGFDESYFASEEYHLSQALKAKGRFAIVRPAVTTSGRKFRLFSAWGYLKQAGRIVLGGPNGLKRREGLGMWYEALREPGKVRAPMPPGDAKS